MRFLTYHENGIDRAAVVRGQEAFALLKGRSLLAVLRSGQTLKEAGSEALRHSRIVRPLEGLSLRAPIPEPPTVRDFMTFESHVQGVARLVGSESEIPSRWYEAPAYYFTNPYAITGPYADVAVPPGCELFDFELEVAAVIGKEGSDVSPETAEGLIAGYTIMNDWSARDLQFAEMQVPLGPVKGKDSSTSIGPVLVTPDELEPWRSGTGYDLVMTAAVNGIEVGRDRWSSMAFSFSQMIAYASRGTVVRPGDILGSGTSGGGCLAELWGRQGRDAHAPLTPGDVVTLSIEELGTLTSKVVEGVSPVPISPAVTRSSRKGRAER
jgi:2-keto-4-pentenoate hydratase/2-oxohepta-3-ene-1,7-dioic acid hydratase in catechol pathway